MPATTGRERACGEDISPNPDKQLDTLVRRSKRSREYVSSPSSNSPVPSEVSFTSDHMSGNIAMERDESKQKEADIRSRLLQRKLEHYDTSVSIMKEEHSLNKWLLMMQRHDQLRVNKSKPDLSVMEKTLYENMFTRSLTALQQYFDSDVLTQPQKFSPAADTSTQQLVDSNLDLPRQQ
eukprot:478444-Hanusia_phi.AAC.1